MDHRDGQEADPCEDGADVVDFVAHLGLPLDRWQVSVLLYGYRAHTPSDLRLWSHVCGPM